MVLRSPQKAFCQYPQPGLKGYGGSPVIVQVGQSERHDGILVPNVPRSELSNPPLRFLGARLLREGPDGTQAACVERKKSMVKARCNSFQPKSSCASHEKQKNPSTPTIQRNLVRNHPVRSSATSCPNRDRRRAPAARTSPRSRTQLCASHPLAQRCRLDSPRGALLGCARGTG